jgi:hypothetical protein
MVKKLITGDSRHELESRILREIDFGWSVVSGSVRVHEKSFGISYWSCEMEKEPDPIIIGGEDDDDGE